ncbi:unnamed protein product [Caenorhabditis angaria]|uniref:Uncharacterized protein n=1 Tax=Caenorhabditis angaria TaxID=860376 RepID=A0A9P1I796_9PELO|nr:unnamed protein product [Caenorhabditis angaria]
MIFMTFPYIEKQDAMKILSNRLRVPGKGNTRFETGFEMTDDEMLNVVRKFLDYLETTGKTFKYVNSFSISFMQKILEKLKTDPTSAVEIFEPEMREDLKDFYVELKREVQITKIDIYDVVDQFIRYAKYIKLSANWPNTVTIGQMRRVLVKVPNHIKYGINTEDNYSIPMEFGEQTTKECVPKISLTEKRRRNAKKSKDEIADINRKRSLIWRQHFQSPAIYQPRTEDFRNYRKMENSRMYYNLPVLDYYPTSLKKQEINNNNNYVKNYKPIQKRIEIIEKQFPRHIPIIMPKFKTCTNFQMQNARFPVFVPKTAVKQFINVGKENMETIKNRQMFSLHLQRCQFPITDISLYSQDDILRNLHNMPQEYRLNLEKKIDEIQNR